jgi:hypothetical protein
MFTADTRCSGPVRGVAGVVVHLVVKILEAIEETQQVKKLRTPPRKVVEQVKWSS